MSEQRPRFPRRDEFRRVLNNRVKAYFAESGIDERGNAQMYLKTFVTLVWLAGCYGLLVGAELHGAWRALLCVVLGAGLAAFVFNVGHDANHGSYARSERVNRTFALSFDLIGVSSFLWRFRHNIVHHTYTNIAGVDHDISTSAPFMRTTERDPYYWFHRYQHLYAWGLYALLPVNWIASDANGLFFSKSYGGIAIPTPQRGDYIAFFVSKIVVVTALLVVPFAAGFGVFEVIAGLLLTYATLGVILAVVFQLAHVLEETDVVYLPGNEGALDNEWAVHQLRTSNDFAPTSRLLGWYLGGLNFQAIHHLFPKVCHVHYPALSRIVADVALAHGVSYTVHPTIFHALASHYRVIRRLALSDAVHA